MAKGRGGHNDFFRDGFWLARAALRRISSMPQAWRSRGSTGAPRHLFVIGIAAQLALTVPRSCVS
jgi:hypothetical protein